MIMDSSFWFYTLSAIPQTLAAIIALTATFVIFKLNHIGSRTQIEYDEIKEWVMPLLPDIGIHDLTKLDDSEMLKKLEEGIGKLDEKKDKLGFKGYDKLCALYQNVIDSHKRHFNPTEERIYEYLLEKKRIYASLLKDRKKALHHLKKSLLLTVIPLVGSIILLPLYEPLHQLAIYRFFIVLFLIIFAVIGIAYTAYSVSAVAAISDRGSP
jgi:hypothetical protein